MTSSAESECGASGLSLGQRVQRAIEAECSAVKAGNVHPHASFADLSHTNFLVAAKAIGQRIDQCDCRSVGHIVLQSVQAMMETAGTNTSLGTILLMAPLVAASQNLSPEVDRTRTLQYRLREILATLTPSDCREIYEAIGMAKPGGLGKSESLDVHQPAPANILDAMKIAASWDDIALQYISGFELVFEIARRIEIKQAAGQMKLEAIRCMQIELLSERVDSLIARKQGLACAKRVQVLAKKLIEAGLYGSAEYESAWRSFDNHLRDTEHRGNPGTTADLIAAALFL